MSGDARRSIHGTPVPSPRGSPPRNVGVNSPGSRRASWQAGITTPPAAPELYRSPSGSVHSRASFQSLSGIPEHAAAIQRSPSQLSVSSHASWQSLNLPMVTQTGEINRALPKIPLRIPAKNPRRSLNPVPIAPPPQEVLLVSSAYVPPSPSYSYPEQRFQGPRSDSYASTAAVKFRDGCAEEKEWASNRQRKCRFLVFVGVITILIIGITVGLSVGLTHQAQTANKTTPQSTNKFPTGKYKIRSSLRSNSTGCTSRASAWACPADSNGSGADLYWYITGRRSSGYTISGENSPIMPAFKDISMTVMDDDQNTERFIFEMTFNKTVLPVDANTPTNRAAKCVFPNTVTQIVLWTRRRGNDTLNASEIERNYGIWPGDVDLHQVKTSTIGEPKCEDKAGAYIADVQASISNCECQYGAMST